MILEITCISEGLSLLAIFLLKINMKNVITQTMAKTSITAIV